MLGLDASTLAVADYEIIARIERIVGSFNEGVLPVHIQPVHQIQLQPTAVAVHHRLPATMSYSGNLANVTDAGTSSSSSDYHHYHHHHRSHSPAKYHHSSSIVQQQELTGTFSSSSASSQAAAARRSPSPHRHYHQHQARSRSKSPRKVTIDPNSY